MSNSYASKSYVAPPMPEKDVYEQCRVTLRLLNLTRSTKYELVQENGQRRLTAPEVTEGRMVRPKGAEIFIGRLPRDCYEDELMPFLARIGRLLELRLMLDFSGTTRGYAFGLFEDSKTARRACRELDGLEIRPGHRVGVVKSIDNCRLFFGGVPKDKTKDEFMQELGKILEGIVDIYLYPSAQDRSLNRGFIFVEFKDHRSAAMARRKLIPGRIVLWDHEIAVDWADPEAGDPVDEDVMETVTALFVRNISLETSVQTVREIFQQVTRIPILKLKKINHFAFVHYEQRHLAERAMEIMNQSGGIVRKEQWEIRWAKPIGTTKMMERQRCIKEAIATSQHRETSKAQPAITMLRRKTWKDIPKGYSEVPLDKTVTYKNILEKFVALKLRASCTLEYCKSIEPPGYVCKITIIQDGRIVFESIGESFSTLSKSINATARGVYEKINGILNNSLTVDTMLNSDMLKLMPAPVAVNVKPQRKK
ncbi:RNA-binding protein 47-like [Orussus abietinus]|uniref:RNA-binding protein 47-like n=1 Tax=Orussus abietinus TaxID=222816 RepID=UPI000C715F4A|nr:RNA-binding protein 47-like [Orussus abietinus]